MAVDLQAEMAIGAQADSLLASDAFTNTIKHLRNQALEDIAASDPADTGSRETLYHGIKAIDQITEHLENLSKGGAIARKQFEALNKRK
jgi:hypothetical protein